MTRMMYCCILTGCESVRQSRPINGCCFMNWTPYSKRFDEVIVKRMPGTAGIVLLLGIMIAAAVSALVAIIVESEQ